jgi:hypothetical protein
VRRTTRVRKFMREFLCSRFVSFLGGEWESRPRSAASLGRLCERKDLVNPSVPATMPYT